ncbi:MAG: PD-(D/E)XK nuclease family protein [Thermoplasmata archaeon]|nr:PD-(D/E)XK nuclease family protein [Thermoplasmata archaeon]
MGIKLSYSSIESYKTCPLQYKLSKIDKIEPEGTTIEAFMGTLVHETLEKLYTDLINGKLDTLRELEEFYTNEWRLRWNPEKVKIVKRNYTPENYFDVGKNCISGYYRKFYPFNQALPLWVEKDFTIDLGEGIEITGVIDRVDRAEKGKYEIHDYKTTGTLPDKDWCEENEQLGIYQLALQEQFDDVEEVRLIWHYLRFDTEREVKRSPEQLNMLKEKLRTTALEILNQKEFEPKKSVLCDWCQYWKHCPLKKHALKLEDFGPEEISEEEGFQLATRYGELHEKIRELEEELEAVKKKLLEYARANKYLAVVGRDCEIKIREYDNVELPEKNSPEYLAIKNEIMAAGLTDELMEIDRFKLSSRVKNAQLPASLMSAVKQFCGISKYSKFYFSQKKKEYTL